MRKINYSIYFHHLDRDKTKEKRNPFIEGMKE